MIALVTGGNRGLGKAICIYLAKKNIDIAFTYNSHKEEAKETLEFIRDNYNIRTHAFKCDISCEEEVEKMINKVLDLYGCIDVLVNNAGICNDSLLFDKTYSDFKKILDVNLIGTFLVSKYVGKIMISQKKGNIINISSNNAIDSYYPESCDYDASKAGVISLTYNLAKEFAPFVRVNCICPGWIKTDMNKDLSLQQVADAKEKILLKRFAEPEEIAKVVYFLISPAASYVNSSIIKVDGGKLN